MTATFNKEVDDSRQCSNCYGNGSIRFNGQYRRCFVCAGTGVIEPLPASQPQRSEESQEEMWREAWGEYCKDSKDANFDGFIRYLKQHYNLTKIKH